MARNKNINVVSIFTMPIGRCCEDLPMTPVSEHVASLCDSVSHRFIRRIRSDLQIAVLVARFATLDFTSNKFTY